MANNKRLSQSMADSWKDAYGTNFINPSGEDTEEWLMAWRTVLAGGSHFS